MAYFNDNCNSYFSPSTPEELGPYPFLQPQASVTAGEVYNGVAPTFTGGWTTVGQPESMADPSAGLLAGASYGSVPSPIGLYPAQPHGSYWPTITQPALPHHPGAWSPDDISPGDQGWETAMQSLHINPTPTDSWGPQSYGGQTNVSYMDFMQNHHHSHSGATRTEMLDSRRFTPYGGYSARPITHGTTVARPSTHIPLYIQHYTPPTIQPTGGLSETAANAKQNKTYTEEDESPATQSRRALGEGFPRLYRERNQKGTHKLRAWAKAQGGHRTLPSHQDAITAAADILTVLKPGVYDEDRLVRGRGRRTKAGSKNADEEYARRNRTRLEYQRLSRHYQLELGRTAWSMPRLLSNVLEDLENLDDLIEQFVASPLTAAG